jgi:homotetrameric cytidine deaminase
VEGGVVGQGAVRQGGPTPEQIEALVAAAWAARRNAYAPYSQFRVGAAILTSGGEIVAGCNVENASFGLTNCAERTAVFAARAAGKLGPARQRRGGGPTIVAVAVVGRGATPPSPCGACRQVLHEFGVDSLVICENLRGERRITSLPELLPGAFGPW